jgi:hypothetical protein
LVNQGFTKQAVAEAYDENRHRLSYEGLGSLLNLSRNQVAGMIRDWRKTQEPPMATELTGPFEKPERKVKPRQQVGLRACVFDIEVTDFLSVGYQGFFICGCIYDLWDNEPRVFAIDYETRGKDKQVLIDYVEALCEYDVIIGHNINAFDLNWLHSRFMYYGLAWPRTWLAFDTYQAAKSLSIKSYKSLGALADYFSLEGEKTSVLPKSWHDIRSDERSEFEEARSSIVYHNVQDCILNRQVFDVLFPYSLSMGTNPFKLSKWRTGAHHQEA